MFMEIPGVYFERCNSFAILEGILEDMPDGVSVTVCSYAVTEVWLRRLQLLRISGRISRVEFLLDFDVMVRHRELLLQLERVCDEVWLTQTHAKMIIVRSRSRCVAAVMSANATQNYRTEVYYVTDRPIETTRLRQQLSGILAGARRLRRTGTGAEADCG